MRWTTERPTEAGWYFYKPTPEERDLDPWEILRVFEHQETGLMAINDTDYDSVANLHGEWAGPIPEPEAREHE